MVTEYCGHEERRKHEYQGEEYRYPQSLPCPLYATRGRGGPATQATVADAFRNPGDDASIFRSPTIGMDCTIAMHIP